MHRILKTLLLVELFFPTAFGLRNFEKFSIQNTADCISFNELFVEVQFRYFRDQHSLTVIDYSADSIANKFKCSTGENIFRPASVFNDTKFLQVVPRKRDLSYYPITHGLFLKSEKNEISEMLSLIASINPRTKLMIMITDCGDDESMKILREAFHKFCMLNVAILIIKGEHGKEPTLKLMMFNPYSGNEYYRKPKFVSFEFTTSNVMQQLTAMDNFIQTRLKNLQGFPLRVNIFDFPMVCKPVLGKNGKISSYTYVDGETLAILSRVMNFTPLYDRLHEDQSKKFGFQYPNGTFIGSLADIEYGYADLAVNPKFITDAYNTSNSVFLYPVTMSRLRFIIRKRPTRKLMTIAIYTLYDRTSKIIVITLSVLFPPIYSIINRWEHQIINSRKLSSSYVKNVLLAFAILNNVSMKQSPFTSSRIIVASILFYTLVVSALFQSTIVKNLNTNERLGRITTIQELTDAGYSMKIPSYISLIFKQPSMNKVSRMMLRANQTYLDVAVASSDLEALMPPNKKIAFLWNDLYATNYLNQFYDKKSGRNFFESVPEPASQFYQSLMAPKSSPLLERFNEVLIQFSETGIGFHHVLKARADNSLIQIRRVKNGEIERPLDKAIKFEDIRTAFEIQLYLLVASCAVLVMEILVSKIAS